MKEKLEKKIQEDVDFQEIIEDLIKNETVQEMKNFRQHFNTDCFEHCYVASYYCYRICKKLKLDYKSAARGAMLHDLFLYDWRIKDNHVGLHAFTHAKTAYDNASKIFELNKIEKDVIIKHMWPVTLAFPRYLESYILTLVDKYCAVMESFEDLRNDFSIKKALNYSYLFLLFVIFKKK